MRRIAHPVVVWILGLAVLFGIAVLTTPPASAEPPKTGPTGKTEKQCNADHQACLSNCDRTIVDVDNQVQLCKDRCDDTMVKCQPLARTQQGGVGRIPGGQFQVAPTNPAPKTSPFQKGGMNAPIMRRGVEGEQPVEPATSTPGTSKQPSGTKPQ